MSKAKRYAQTGSGVLYEVLDGSADILDCWYKQTDYEALEVQNTLTELNFTDYVTDKQAEVKAFEQEIVRLIGLIENLIEDSERESK